MPDDHAKDPIAQGAAGSFVCTDLLIDCWRMDVAAFLARLDGLATAFNRGSLDVPDGTLDRRCTFRLNGTTYAETMGQPLSSPLVRLVALGPAGYRFLAQAVRYAMPDARVDLGDVTVTHHEHGGLATALATLTGTFRGRHAQTETGIDVAFVVGDTGSVIEVGAHAPQALVSAITEARRL